ncbi:MAG: Ig-like domain-containing protein [Muribaculaceae bacterium]|nr:Ig-like domain-containing protein [Muribaculaceae bacterium]
MSIFTVSGTMRIVAGAVVGLCLAACASMGRPDGGARDVEPPVFVRSNPAMGELNVKRNRISIEFNENVQVKDAMSKIVVSPAQITPPQVMAVGRRVNFTLRDSLLPNTTYTIDCSDAISDLNEGNEVDGFSFAFSTGPTIDTLQISGMVFEAANLEPAQGIVVGVYSNLSDTAITTLPLERITKTNQLGQFTIRNLKEGTYRIFALNDINRDYKWDRSEDVAFYDMTITPTAERVTVTDTLKSANGMDSLVIHDVTRFLPNDILLTWFNEGYRAQYLQKYERTKREAIDFIFGAPADTLPQITLLNPPRGERYDIRRWSVLQASRTLDTLKYWISDPEILNQDTLLLEARYMRTDSLEQLSLVTDTLRLTMRGTKKKEEKKDKKKDNDSTKVEKTPLMSVTVGASNPQEVNLPLILKSQTPIVNFDQRGVHMTMLVDTVWEPVAAPRFVMPDSLNPTFMVAEYVWEPKSKYTLTIDSLAMTDVGGLHNGPVRQELTTRALEDYSSITFSLPGIDNGAVAELLSSQDAPVARAEVKAGRAEFTFLQPGTYYARLFLDRNGNGKYDTGNLLDSIQPEEVFYYPKKITLKKNWDVADQVWNIYETPVDKQKPSEIKKNKPKRKAGEIPEDDQMDEEDDDGFDVDDPFGNRRSNNRSNNRNTNRGNSIGRGRTFDRGSSNMRSIMP